MKTTVNRIAVLSALGLVCALGASAAVPSPDQLLADDTLAVLTIPNYRQAKAAGRACAMSRLWDDPAMRPFRQKLAAKVKSDVIEPLEREFGFRLDDYRGLVQGQITLAATRNDWGAVSGKEPGFLLLADTGDKADVLRTNLAGLRRNWVDGGKQVRSETIRGVEFTVLLFSTDDLKKGFERVSPSSDAGDDASGRRKTRKPGKKLEWWMGQSGSLFLLGNSAKEMEKVLIRQSGGAVRSLREHRAWGQAQAAEFRRAHGYGWVDTRTLSDVLIREAAAKAAAKAAGEDRGEGMAPTGDKVLSALGLRSMECVALSSRMTPEGDRFSVFVGSPESSRKGLMKVLSFESKDAGPPAFVPADAVKFSRWRLDLQRTLNLVESMLVEAAPSFAGVIKLLVDNAGKDKDPNFDLRQNLIANLGNDIISFEKLPRQRTADAAHAAPSLLLLSSPRSDQLASALKAVTGLLPGRTLRVREREFLGRTVYSMDLPASTAPASSKPVQRKLSFAASGGYVAISTDEGMLEEYLRSSSGFGKSLRDTPGLAQAADQVGGMQTGLFGYENDKETTGALWETLRKDADSIAILIGAASLGAQLDLGDGGNKLKDWLDCSLLPPFEQVARYFSISVFSGVTTPDGLSFKLFTPTPANLR